jgi:hypothetical protein
LKDSKGTDADGIGNPSPTNDIIESRFFASFLAI